MKDKIAFLEKEKTNLSKEVGTKQEAVTSLNDDVNFYKQSFKEQKDRINREHELISTSLYELAMQFMSLKNELQKKINPEK